MNAPMPANLPDDLITYDEAATLLGGNNQRVRHLVAYKRLHPYKVPGYKHKFLSRAEVEQVRRGAHTSYDSRGHEVGQAAETAPLLGGYIDKVNAFFQHAIDQNTAIGKAITEQNAAATNNYTVTLSTLAEMIKLAPSHPSAKEALERFFNEPDIEKAMPMLAEGMPAIGRAMLPAMMPASPAFDDALVILIQALLPAVTEKLQRTPALMQQAIESFQAAEKDARDPMPARRAS